MSLGEKVILLNALCDLHELPDDVRHYLGIHFYGPFHHAAREKQMIEQFSQTLYAREFDFNVDSLEKLRSKISTNRLFLEELQQFIALPLFILDTRIRDGRIETYVGCIPKMRQVGIDLKSIFPVLLKGIEIDYHEAFDLLRQSNIRSLHPSVLAYIHRHSVEFAKLSSWTQSYHGTMVTDYHRSINLDHMKPIIYYCIENEIDEFLIEWACIWPLKGCDVLKECLHWLYGPNSEQADKLYARLQAPELKEKRQALMTDALKIWKSL